MRSPVAALLFAVVGLLAVPWLAAGPVISEFLAEPDGGRSLVDEEGEASDWVEIVNEGAEPVDLAGYGLSDDRAVPLKWVFPSRLLAPGGRLVVFASGKNRRPASGALHTNFALAAEGEALVLAGPGGTVVDGFPDGYPRQRRGVSYGRARPLRETRVIGLGTPCRYRVATGPVTGWSQRVFADGAWTPGVLAVGYDLDGQYEPIIGAGSDTEAAMYNRRTSAYVRVPFTLEDPGRVRALELRMKYDDGFDAFVNGAKAATRYMPEAAAWNAVATQNRIDALNDRYEVIDIRAAIGSLVAGENVLALQGSNFTANGLDFLIDPELWIFEDEGGAGFDGYFETPTPGAPNHRAVLGFVEDTKFSLNRGFYSAPVDLTLTTATPGATIRYTLDGAPPTATTGTVYGGPLRIATTTTVRAAAFKDGHHATDVDAHSYLFTADVRTQPDMLPSVVNAPAYSAVIEPGLRSLPVVALSLRDSDFFGENGIYTIATLSGRAQEIEASVEYFDPAGGRSVQAGAGLRIHGGNARTHPKKPLRLYFREAYGDRQLRFPLFDGSPVSAFDQLLLRPGGHDSWSLAFDFGTDPTDLPPHATFMRDAFLRRTENAIGLLSPRGRFVNLFINGRYWGLYDLHERANAAFFADHLGGEEADYDVVHHPEFVGDTHTVVEGSGDSWEALVGLAEQGVEGSRAYTDISKMLVIDDFIDHMIVRMWSGDYDWCGPIFRGGEDVTVFDTKNWYAGRRVRGGRPDGYRLFTWDAEMSMGNHLMVNLTGEPVAQRVTDFDLTRANDPGSPAGLYDALRRNAAFRLRFADRLQKHFFNGGAMTPEANAARWASMAATIEAAVVGESARWGHESFTTLTRDTHWLPEVNWVQGTFIPSRNATMLAQFRAAGLWPRTAAPVFSRSGGAVRDDGTFRLTVNGEAGATVYVTTDGSDPYVPPSVEISTLVGESAVVSVLVPDADNGGAALGGSWRDLPEPANATEWTTGLNGVGYETAPENFADLIQTDVSSMYRTSGSVFLRILFEIADPAALAAMQKLTLAMRYDDGFVACLNGVRVAAANAPADPGYDSVATGNHPDRLAVNPESFDLTEHVGALKTGANLLAIHGLNDGVGSSDLLLQAVLQAAYGQPGGPSPGAFVSAGPIAPGPSGEVRARAVSADGEWSPLTEARFLFGTPASAANLVISEMAYRPAGPATVAEAAAGAVDRGAFEFIEVTNVSATAITLTGVRFTAGIAFDFTGSAVDSLDPGESAVVVSNAESFIARYGAALRPSMAGTFAGQTSLANEGEFVQLTAADGSVIGQFFYGVRPPWPEAANGHGYTLEIREPASRPDPNDPRNWRASLDVGGTPAGVRLDAYEAWARRYFDPAAPDFAVRAAPDADPDGDGLVNRWEHLLALPPGHPDGSGLRAGLTTDADARFLWIEADLRPGAADAVRVEASASLRDWSPAAVVRDETIPSPDTGRERVRFRMSEPVTTGSRFLRLVAAP